MNLKEIIIEELRHTLNLYKSRDNSEISIDIAFELEPMIKGIANNIISKMDWQVIASGEIILDVDDVFISFPIIQGVEGLYSLGNINSSLFGKYMGKNIEIAIRIKE